MSLCSVDATERWRPTTTSRRCCREERRVATWVRCNIIVLVATARLESLYRRGRVVVVVDCSAVECDHWGSRRPTRDLHCLMTSEEAAWRPCMKVESYRGRLLHSPTHTVTRVHWLTAHDQKAKKLKLSQSFLYSASYRETWPAALYNHQKWQLIVKSQRCCSANAAVHRTR